jgi:hypothetical protein
MSNAPGHCRRFIFMHEKEGKGMRYGVPAFLGFLSLATALLCSFSVLKIGEVSAYVPTYCSKPTEACETVRSAQHLWILNGVGSGAITVLSATGAVFFYREAKRAER